MNEEEMKTDFKQTVIVGVMIVLLCAIFYGIGYGYSYKNNAIAVRTELQEWIEEQNLCLMECPLDARYMNNNKLLNLNFSTLGDTDD